ncbi:hypothetical protein IFR05_000389 [Cadophora sp. M221]|nr:hypothetical protein IFR05_000389 [Cadophora sp. M221]
MSSSAYSSSGSSSHSGSLYLDSSHSNSLLQLENIIEDHPKDTLPHSADALPHSVDALPHSADALPHLADTPPSPLLHKDTRSKMPPRDRSRGRDVHIFDARDRNTSIGGLILTAGITNANLYAMIQIFVIFEGEYSLQNESNVTILRDNNFLLLPGNYYIISSSPIQINNETPLLRTISLQTGTRVQAFTDAVRSRDGRCVISGKIAFAHLDFWTGFEAAHIFPLAFEGIWKDYNYGRWVLTPPDEEEIKGGKINSSQNGLLLRSDIHQLFDMYFISINPDDNYKIVCFAPDSEGIAGKYFDQRPLDDPQRPADQLLRWHFRQAVLTNMRGAGEPVFEHDFPPGSDIMGSILEGPKAAERMEFELFNRFATQIDLT